MILVPSTFSDAGQVYVCAYRYVCLRREKSFLFMLQSCITSINSLITIGFRILKSVKFTSGKLYMFIVTKNILYTYMIETYCVHKFSELAIS